MGRPVRAARLPTTLLVLLVLAAPTCSAGTAFPAPHDFADPRADHGAAGVAFDRAGDLRSALAAFRAARRFQPADAGHHANLGVACMRAGTQALGPEGPAAWYGRAKGALERALALEPENRATHNAQADLARNVRVHLGVGLEALEALGTAVPAVGATAPLPAAGGAA